MDNPTSGNLGPTCPDCGTPLRSAGHDCPHCGYSPRAPRPVRGGLMAPFGYGFCGFGVGGMAGLVLSLLYAVPPGPTAALKGLLLCIIGATVAAQVGKRLAPELHCSYEHLLLSLLSGGVVTMMVAVAGPPAPAVALGLWLAAATGAYLLLRRYGYRAGAGDKDP